MRAKFEVIGSKIFGDRDTLNGNKSVASEKKTSKETIYISLMLIARARAHQR